MSRPSVIAVCGISGVGKTYLINRVVAGLEHVTRLSAGSIIAEARSSAHPEFLRKLPVDELDRSQELLIAGFSRALADIRSRLLLLDAHTVIDNGSDELYLVADSVFAALRPDGIIHVEAEPELIVRQREADSVRPRPSRSVKVLDNQQRASAQRAEQLAAGLGIWCARVRSGDVGTFESLLAVTLDEAQASVNDEVAPRDG